jgi:glutathione S-transferase
MTKPFLLLGWQLSYFTGKTRAHLRYKRIAYTEHPINLWQYLVQAPRKTGAAVMPVLISPEGEWLQDSSVIIDRLEARFPVRSVDPDTPLQWVLDALLEAWADEWWIPAGMHTRWSYPAANWPLFRQEAGAHLLPGWPRWLQDAAARRARSAMHRHLPTVGIVPAQFATIEAWTCQLLGLLDQHFAVHDFLLGGRPGRSDFALLGPFYGHLARDPWPKQELVAPHPHLRRWLERMNFAELPSGEFLPEDAIAATLLPVLQTVFGEFLPWCSGIVEQMAAHVPRPLPGQVWPRSLGSVTVSMAERPFQRAALPYVLWMLQRVQDRYLELPGGSRAAVDDWLQRHGGGVLTSLQFPRLERRGLRVLAT